MTVCFYGHTFNWEFVFASIAVPITGAESLCANGLLVDLANHHLIDAVSFATFLCQTGGFGPLMHASFFALASDFQCLMAEFLSLTTTAFSSAVAWC